MEKRFFPFSPAAFGSISFFFFCFFSLFLVFSSSGDPLSPVFDLEGEEGFRDREEKVINELTEKQGIVLATGGGSVKSRETRNRLSARGVVVYLETTIEKQLARTQRDKKRPLLHVET